MRRPIVIANWKMYGSLSDAIVLATGIRDGIENFSGVEIILCPPAIWLTEVAGIIHKRIDQLALGAQNIHYLSEGEFTGEISATMVCDVARYAIVGHSERRKNFGETASIVARKAAAALDAGLSPIVCVGEQKKSEDSVQKVVDELKELLSDVRKSEYRDIVVAYEPVWAVGANEPATPEYSARVIVKLREIVSA
ncbi:triose-phosphate isomerase, partial [Candidatus Berkelbacteria bacterium CG_4_10_14_0_8_um_filter_42_34]